MSSTSLSYSAILALTESLFFNFNCSFLSFFREIISVLRIGGGVVTVPLLMLCLPNLSQHQIVSTSLASMIFPAISASFSHYRNGALNIRGVMGPLALGTIMGATIGSYFASHHLPDKEMRMIFSGFLAFQGITTFRKASH
jgi:uncharacterized membrane protein YfcA